jgi:hypothetical protein
MNSAFFFSPSDSGSVHIQWTYNFKLVEMIDPPRRAIKIHDECWIAIFIIINRATIVITTAATATTTKTTTKSNCYYANGRNFAISRVTLLSHVGGNEANIALLPRKRGLKENE